MKKGNGMLLIICGAVLTALTGIIIAIGVIQAIEMSQYREIGMNVPVIALVALVLIAGVAALIAGIRKMKAAKQNGSEVRGNGSRK